MLNPTLQAVVLYHTHNRDLQQNSDASEKLVTPLEPRCRPFVFPDELSIVVKPYFLDLPEDFRAVVLDLFQHAAWSCYGQKVPDSRKPAGVLRWFKQAILFWRRKHERGSEMYENYTKALLFTSDYREAGLRIAAWAIADLDKFVWALLWHRKPLTAEVIQ